MIENYFNSDNENTHYKNKNIPKKDKFSKKLLSTLFGISFFFLSAYSSQIQEPRSYPYPTKIVKRIESEDAKKNNKKDYYAVLIRGDNEQRHNANLAVVTRSLLENGVKPQNMYVLTHSGKSEFYSSVDDVATLESVRMVFDHLKKKIDDKDYLFIYLNNHGNKTLRKSTSDDHTFISSFFSMAGPRALYDFDLEYYLSDINPKLGLIVADFCHSGGFAQMLGKGNYIAISSSQISTPSYSRTNNSFSGFLMQSLTHEGIRKGSDSDKDGLVSILEMIDYASIHHDSTRNKKQQYNLSSDKNISQTYFFRN